MGQPPSPPEATDQRCANINKSLETKQTSCWNISQLPFRNKCPALTFLKLWQKQLPPQEQTGTEMFYFIQLKKKSLFIYFYRIQKFCHTPIKYVSYCTSESSHLTLLHIFRCLSLSLLTNPAENKNMSYSTWMQPSASSHSQSNNKHHCGYWVMHMLRESCPPSEQSPILI